MNEQQTQGDIKGIAARPAAKTAETDAALDGFQDALEELIQFATEDGYHSGCAVPGGSGAYGPDTATMDRLVAKVNEAARAAFAPPIRQQAVSSDSSCSGLLTVRAPGARWDVTR